MVPSNLCRMDLILPILGHMFFLNALSDLSSLIANTSMHRIYCCNVWLSHKYFHMMHSNFFCVTLPNLQFQICKFTLHVVVQLLLDNWLVKVLECVIEVRYKSKKSYKTKVHACAWDHSNFAKNALDIMTQ